MESGIDSSNELRVRQYDDKTFVEYTDKLVLAPYMGTDTEAVIQVKENLMKSKGDQDTFALRVALSGEGLEGDSVLEGNEEEMEFHDYSVTLNQYKNAVKSKGQLSERRTAFDLKDEARPALADWAAQKTENLFFRDLATINGVAYGTATEVQKDAWTASNADRVLFGNAKSNNSSNDHSASLLNIDSTNDILGTNVLTLARRMAQLASPKIRPIRLENGEEVYVMFAHPYAVRDLKATDAWKQAQQYAMPRGSDNPIFSGAVGKYDGVIVVETPKCLVIPGVGAGTIDVCANFLCGAQAAVVEYGGFLRRPGSKMLVEEELFDYKSQWGVALFMMMGHGKTIFNSKQHGVITVYTAAVAD